MRNVWLVIGLMSCADKESQEARVGNAPPGPFSIELHPPNPTAADDLTIDIVIPSEDPEGEQVEYFVEWFVDGESINGVDSLTLESMFTARDEKWSTVVTAFDGVLEGGQAGASVFIANSEPTIESIVITPDEIREKSEVNCEYADPVDLDNDVIQQLQLWEVNGAELDVRGPLFDTHFDKGDEIACVVYADDGVGENTPHVSAPAVVLNSVPHVIGCSLEDNEPPEDEPLEVISEGFIDEDGDPEGYLFQWYVNGVPTSTEETLDAAFIDAGDNVYVECTAWDGDEAGNTVVSGHGTVQASG